MGKCMRHWSGREGDRSSPTNSSYQELTGMMGAAIVSKSPEMKNLTWVFISWSWLKPREKNATTNPISTVFTGKGVMDVAATMF